MKKLSKVLFTYSNIFLFVSAYTSEKIANNTEVYTFYMYSEWNISRHTLIRFSSEILRHQTLIKWFFWIVIDTSQASRCCVRTHRARYGIEARVLSFPGIALVHEIQCGQCTKQLTAEESRWVFKATLSFHLAKVRQLMYRQKKQCYRFD